MAEVEMDDIEFLIGSRPSRNIPDNEVLGGSRQGLSFRIVWDRKSSATNGLLRMSVGENVVWGDDESCVRLDMQRFLNALTINWDHIFFAESYPLGVTPDWPSGLPKALRTMGSRQRLPDLTIRRHIHEFRLCHDLSSWVNQVAVGPLWVMRQGNQMVIEAGDNRLLWPYPDVKRTLTLLGNAIAQQARVGNWPKADIVERWERRDEAVSMEAFGLRLGMEQDTVQHLLDCNVIQFPRSRAETYRGLDENQMAARMLSHHADFGTIQAVLENISKIPRLVLPKLDDLSRTAQNVLKEQVSQSPENQGRAIAHWFRKHIGRNTAEDSIDLDALLNEWGVFVHEIAIEPKIEAISVWGVNHGPGILLNRRGAHSHKGGGRRATLAHEICHLLVDRSLSLFSAEVFGGATPRIPEKRANCFSSELLVPAEWAIAEYRDQPTVEDTVDVITRKYQVTKTLAALQLLTYNHSNWGTLGENDRTVLEKISH